jgi:hypothetical protein
VSLFILFIESLANGIPVKKKYLLVNKHVTKLNSTLSVRVEELNDQLSMLQLENLRLRSANISLSAQLRREKESRGRGSDPKTVALIDAAVSSVNSQKCCMFIILWFTDGRGAPTADSYQRRSRQWE